jgi:hypothetical protein
VARFEHALDSGGFQILRGLRLEMRLAVSLAIQVMVCVELHLVTLLADGQATRRPTLILASHVDDLAGAVQIKLLSLWKRSEPKFIRTVTSDE